MCRLLLKSSLLFLHSAALALPGDEAAECIATLVDGGAQLPAGNPDGLAFPTAEGAGRNALGGRGGAVYQVTNLDDSGAGSLRACVEASGARTCVFQTGGTIMLNKTLAASNPFLTIAGQTAPGDGIQLRLDGSENDSLLSVETDDVVIRHIRSRPGPSTVPGGACCRDAVFITGSSDVILDHVSMAWSEDELLDMADSSNITVQWSILGEALAKANHKDGDVHSMCLLHGPGTTPVSTHHSLFVSCNQRNPRQQSGVHDFRNNTIHNFGEIIGELSDGSSINYIGTTITQGPSSSDPRAVLLTSDDDQAYVDDLDSSRPEIIDEPSRIDGAPFAAPPVTTQSAARAHELVLAGSGATVPRRDAVDTRLIGYVTTGGGRLIDDPSEVGGWPTLAAGTPWTDADLDGMEDGWEVEMGLDPQDAADRNDDALGYGYTNLEYRLMELAGDVDIGCTSLDGAAQ